jgi:hypothetical protein
LLIMRDWLSNSLICEINTWVWLDHWSAMVGRPLSLRDVPEQAWDRLADLGVSAVWLMGVWERSPAGLEIARRNRQLIAELRRVFPDFSREDLIGSPYSIRRFQVDSRLGGASALAAARQALALRGIRLVLDFVPNHLAPDHPWVSQHPDWFLQGTAGELRRSPGAFMRMGSTIFARGRDPYFPPWSDVLQLNTFNEELRTAMAGELQRIAAQCDGVRCDMAMLVLNEIFAQTWGKRAGPPPAREYWPPLIQALRSSHPDFRFIAEAYWDKESTLLDQGFDACYDKALYDQLAHGTPASIRQHLLRFAASADRLVRFLENHDEPRAAQVFPGPKGLAATVLLLTLPGVRLVHDGQIEGRRVRTPLHVRRQPAENLDLVFERHQVQLFKILRRPVFHLGQWSLCSTTGWPDNPSHENLLAWTWHTADDRWLVIVNYSAQPAQGRVQLPWTDLDSRDWDFVDALQNSSYRRPGAELFNPGLFVALEPWAFHLFRIQRTGP